MAEYIEREAAIKALTLHDCDSAGSKMAICDLPAADVAPVVHGQWVIVDDGVMIGDGKHMECSECHTWKKDRIKTDYCPICGAKMDLKEELMRSCARLAGENA